MNTWKMFYTDNQHVMKEQYDACKYSLKDN